MNSKSLLVVTCIVMIICSCKKDRYVFTMKYVKLNSCNKKSLPDKNLFIKVIDTDEYHVLATTDNYSTTLTLPVTLNLSSYPQINLYKKDNIIIQLCGDSSGVISSSRIHMKKYKIMFPLEMETEEEDVSFTVIGTWK